MDTNSPIYKKIISYEKEFVRFDRGKEDTNFCPMHITPPTEEGMYVTIRCGYTGIYQVLNEWKNGKWQMECTDGSTTIAYSRNTITL